MSRKNSDGQVKCLFFLIKGLIFWDSGWGNWTFSFPIFPLFVHFSSDFQTWVCISQFILNIFLCKGPSPKIKLRRSVCYISGYNSQLMLDDAMVVFYSSSFSHFHSSEKASLVSFAALHIFCFLGFLRNNLFIWTVLYGVFIAIFCFIDVQLADIIVIYGNCEMFYLVRFNC